MRTYSFLLFLVLSSIPFDYVTLGPCTGMSIGDVVLIFDMGAGTRDLNSGLGRDVAKEYFQQALQLRTQSW